MRNAPEVVREVGVNDFRVAAKQQCFHLDHRLLSISPRTVGILLGWKIGELPWPGGMKSINAIRPSSVLKTVSSTMVPSRYARLTCGAGSAGWMRHRPWSEVPSRAAKQALLSKRGQHSQSMDPLRPTRAALVQSPISA